MILSHRNSSQKQEIRQLAEMMVGHDLKEAEREILLRDILSRS